MPLNYSKWDQLELSDDSDIEGHPNVDKKSLIRWKQRDIHEKREARKRNIAKINAELTVHEVLRPRFVKIKDQVAADGPAYFSQLVDKLTNDPSPEKPSEAEGQPTYDAMVLAMLVQVSEEVKKEELEKDDPKFSDALVNGIATHIREMDEHNEKRKVELEEELKEQKKHITSEDIKEGWDSHYVPPKPEPAPLVAPKTEKKKTEYEVINQPSIDTAKSTAAAASEPVGEEEEGEDDDDDDDGAIPALTPNLVAFSKIPVKAYQQSFEFIQAHRDVVVAGATDALLIESFQAQTRGEFTYAKQCVHQALLLQYCEKLGSDGVGVFFKKMVAGDPRAERVFVDDVEKTYNHVVTRVKANKANPARDGTQETLQLFPEQDGADISFNVPDGPPPDELILEGPGTENMDVEQVKRLLQIRWEVFSQFPTGIQEGLKNSDLTAINKELAKMKIEDAENLVKELEYTGILHFAEGGAQSALSQPAIPPPREGI